MKVLLFFIIFAMMLGHNILAEESELFPYNDHNRRDPLWRLVSSDGAIINYDTDLLISDLTIEGIIYDPHGKSFAIVNGNVVKSNDKIGQYIVKSIEQRRVILTNGHEDFLLELKKEE